MPIRRPNDIPFRLITAENLFRDQRAFRKARLVKRDGTLPFDYVIVSTIFLAMGFSPRQRSEAAAAALA